MDQHSRGKILVKRKSKKLEWRVKRETNKLEAEKQIISRQAVEGIIFPESAEVDSKGSVLVKHKLEKLELRVEDGEQLLPGILDDVTIAVIAPKLPWTAFHILASVSRAWQKVIRSHEVHHARVRSHSTQKLVLIDSSYVKDVTPIALYSLVDGSSHQLPPIPSFKDGRLPFSSQCISLDGKLYVLGGLSTVPGVTSTSAKVYVLDVAGQRKWKQCASMKDPRADFGCAVINGKIYVFGGKASMTDCVHGSEVYDPKADVWSAIAPVKPFGFYQKAITMGEELLVYNEDWRFEELDHQVTGDGVRQACFAEIYHPLKNQWTVVDHFRKSPCDIFLMVAGRLHRVTYPWLGIDVYDSCEKSWKPSQPFSFSVFGPPGSFSVHLIAAVARDDEIFAIVIWNKLRGLYNNENGGICPMRGQGVGSQNTEIVWQEMQCSPYSGFAFPRLDAVIQL